MDFTTAITLQNEHALLRPLQLSDMTELAKVALDASIWRYTVTRISTPNEVEQWLQEALLAREKQQRYMFAIVDKVSGQLAGSTAFGNISDRDKRLEIGWTWLGSDFWGTGLNRHCKFLLLSYAFEELQYERVELKTDVRNTRSRKAMLKLGTTEEGVLRSHTLMHDGHRRDTVYYSMLRQEWPIRKATVFADLLP
ncbi:GNAT family N-acetyltransferase [Pontibacter qinzhouensis]|uniref:GNAT family N-acetyltransferase n=1 Tax=Pontibacter qinzhouensis TaxID=2603253 RepID=A0A5C8K8S1_9BACT|nr:GNAT family protein [Pontibacter qinzhouensis]TXK45759.1 GNAT family N-acetyltransferase [Pontibacter qinzhouensis]